ncbi:MAG: hypothetical protein JWN10_2251 [Solirubrobacterales bacterium]|nr:hypothetical protein [Solirubrobacterales bacterium]
MPRRSTFGPPLLAVGVALTVAGCGSSASTTSNSATASAPAASTAASTSADSPFLAALKTASTVASTVPGNGDVNPYGIVTVPASAGKLTAGDLLISNFNDKANNQGTGTTIVQVSPAGRQSSFATVTASSLPGSCPGGVGLTTALSVLPGGYVVVGSLPTANGKSATARLGCLIVLDSGGKPVSTISGSQIAGPWDMTSTSQGNETSLFVSNALNGGAAKGVYTVKNSTVLRIRLRSGAGEPPKVLGEQVIANKIPWRDDPAALVVGPTGVALASDGTLYLADTLDNRIAAIPNAVKRTSAAPDGGATVSEGGLLKQPLGLIVAPNGNILTTNAGDGNVVETTPAGKQVTAQTADAKTGEGSLFGLALAPEGKGVYYVDDGENTLRLLH